VPDRVSAISRAARQLSRQSRNCHVSRDSRLVAAAMGQLMDTLAAAIARDAASVPKPVADAALRLAQRIDGTDDAAPGTTRRPRPAGSMNSGRMG